MTLEDKLLLIVKGVRELAEQYSDHSYAVGQYACSYVTGSPTPDGCQGCIVGQSARKYAPDIYDMLVEAELGFSPVSSGVKDVLSKYIIVSTDLKWLNTVQKLQDSGDPWSQCVTKADELYLISE